MSRDEIFEAFEELESLARRARCMAWFLDDAINSVLPSGEVGAAFATELDRELIGFAKLEVASTCDTIAANVAALHNRIRDGWKAEDAAGKTV